MACVFEGGVIVAADSRTTTGSYIANRLTDKLTPVHDQIFCCRSGSASDTQIVADYVKYYLQIHTTQLGELPLVKTAATLFSKIIYENKNSLLASIIVAGWDPVKGGSVWNVSLGGSLVEAPFAIGGSGSGYIYGYTDKYYKDKMTEKECKEFCTTAVAMAMSRDGSSGGVIRLAVITKDGVKREVVSGDNIPTFFEGL
jgi:20S proteasome subunit beta 1